MKIINHLKNLSPLMVAAIAILSGQSLMGYTITVTNGTNETIIFQARILGCDNVTLKIEKFETASANMGTGPLWIPCCIDVSNSFKVNSKPIIHDKSMKLFSPCSSLSVIIREGAGNDQGKHIIAKYDNPIRFNKKYSSAQIAQAKKEVLKDICLQKNISIEDFYRRVNLYLDDIQAFQKMVNEEKMTGTVSVTNSSNGVIRLSFDYYYPRGKAIVIDKFSTVSLSLNSLKALGGTSCKSDCTSDCSFDIKRSLLVNNSRPQYDQNININKAFRQGYSSIIINKMINMKDGSIHFSIAPYEDEYKKNSQDPNKIDEARAYVRNNSFNPNMNFQEFNKRVRLFFDDPQQLDKILQTEKEKYKKNRMP